MKKVIIQQECGLGDILFCQGISHHFKEKGYEIIWPVVKELVDTVKYLNTGVNFYNRDEEYPLKQLFKNLYESKRIFETQDNDIFIPLGYSSHMIEPYGRKVMQAKYKICGLDYKQWKSHFTFTKNVMKENELFYDVLNLKDDEDFILLNENYATQPGIIKKDLSSVKNTFGDGKFIKMRFVEGFTLFDWCKVFEKMKSIITVDTSLMYILEKLNLKNKTNFFCVTRAAHVQSEIQELFSNPWRYAYYD